MEPVWILVLADKFCYLGDMRSIYGDADAAVKAGESTKETE